MGIHVFIRNPELFNLFEDTNKTPNQIMFSTALLHRIRSIAAARNHAVAICTSHTHKSRISGDISINFHSYEMYNAAEFYSTWSSTNKRTTSRRVSGGNNGDVETVLFIQQQEQQQYDISNSIFNNNEKDNGWVFMEKEQEVLIRSVGEEAKEDDDGDGDSRESESKLREAVERLSRHRKTFVRSIDDIPQIELLMNKLHGERALFRYCEDKFSFNKSMWKQSWKSFAEYVFGALEDNAEVKSAMQRAIDERKEYELLWALYLSRTVDMYEDIILSRGRASELADLSNPHEFYPEARSMDRKFIFHSGPTNSGKTHNAFQRLSEAKSGIYAAPLRLLAAEGFFKMQKQGLKCNLITGDHKIITAEDATHVACTVEMAALNAPVDVTVIDEIQMAGDADRGWAWTRALLGIRSKEIHVCGEERAVQIMSDICAEMGEQIEVRRYERLTKLKIMEESIGDDLRKIRKGDCVITFSRSNIFKLKAEIERSTGLKCAVVFGGLPPASRLEQARLFNEPNSKYDVLLATDAIGYGLNLNIGRIVFHTLMKFDGTEKRYLDPAQIRQIAGRAGRFGTRFPDGEVTCFKQEDCALVQAAFEPDAVPELLQVGLRPSEEQLGHFSKHYPNSHKLSDLIKEFEKLTKCSNNYFVCNSDDQKTIADLLHDLDLPFHDRVTFTHVPVDIDEPYAMHMLYSWTKRYSEGKPVNIYVDVPERMPKTSSQLRELEIQYKVLESYCWLSYRYPEFFVERKLAEKKKQQCQKMIDGALKDPVLMREFEERRRQRRDVLKERRMRQEEEQSSEERRRSKKRSLGTERAKLRRKLEELGISDTAMTLRNRV